MFERPPILESGPSSGATKKIGPSLFESWTAFPNTGVRLPSHHVEGDVLAGLNLCSPFSVSSVLSMWRVVKKMASWRIIGSLSSFVFGREEEIDSIALEWSPCSKSSSGG